MIAGSTLKLAVVVVFGLACCSPSVTATLNMSDVCALLSDGSKIASGNACDTYYQCTGGLATLASCPNSLYFDKDTQSCVAQTDVVCLTDGSQQDPCLGRSLGTFAPVAGACAGYYYCSATGPLRGNCPAGQSFNAQTQSCIYNSDCNSLTNYGGSSNDDGTTSTPIDLCTYIANGVYFGSAANCMAWNLCTNNIMSTGFCPNNFVFNPSIGLCDYQSNWSCSQVTNDPDLVGSDGGPCTDTTQTKASSSCNTYYQCNGATYQLVECPNGLYYDENSGTCVNRMDAHNDCDRCVGSTNTFVNMYSTTNCTGYLYCQNGVKVSSGYCTTGFFDELYQACVIEDDPPYPCCNPNVGSTTMTPDNTTTAPGDAETTTAPEDAETTTATEDAETTTATEDAETTTLS